MPARGWSIPNVRRIASDSRRRLGDEPVDPRCSRQIAPGSYLALGHHTADIFPELEEFSRYLSRLNPEYTATLRSRDQVTGFFGDLELVPPGVVQISQWRPDSDYDADLPAALWGGVARKA